MSFFQRMRTAYQNLERLAEAMEYDPIKHVHRRIDQLEQRLDLVAPRDNAEAPDRGTD